MKKIAFVLTVFGLFYGQTWAQELSAVTSGVTSATESSVAARAVNVSTLEPALRAGGSRKIGGHSQQASVIGALPEATPVPERFEPVTLTGELQIEHVDDFAAPENSFYQYFLRQGHNRLELHFATFPGLPSGSEITVHGYRSGNMSSLVVSDFSPAVSGEVEPQLIPESLGDQHTLVLLVRFTDSLETPFTREEAEELFFHSGMQDFYAEQSDGQVSFSGEVKGWYTLPRDGDPAGFCLWPRLGFDGDLDELVLSEVPNLSSYRRVVIAASHPCISGGTSVVGTANVPIGENLYHLSVSRLGSLGLATAPHGNMPFTWTSLDFTLSHELGHALGVGPHANGLDCGSSTLHGESCASFEYGNYFDAMGWGTASLHFNAWAKELLHWFSADDVVEIRQSGTYHLRPYEYHSGPRYAKIFPSGSDDAFFYVEFRRGLGFDAKLNNDDLASNQNGLMVNRVSVFGETGGSRAELLDFSPGDLPWYQDGREATLNLGEPAFLDPYSGVTIGPVLSVDETGVTFAVGLETLECSRVLPTASFSYQHTLGLGAGSYVFANITNPDSPACPPANFDFSLAFPPGWQMEHGDSTSFVLEPQASLLRLMMFSVLPEASLGQQEITVTVTNEDSGLVFTQALPVTVVPAPFLMSVVPNPVNPGHNLIVYASHLATTTLNQLTISSGPNYRFLSLPGVNNGTRLTFPMPTVMMNSSCDCEVPTPAGSYSIRVRSNEATSNSLNLEVLP